MGGLNTLLSLMMALVRMSACKRQGILNGDKNKGGNYGTAGESAV